jgi:hypothetical protein
MRQCGPFIPLDDLYRQRFVFFSHNAFPAPYIRVAMLSARMYSIRSPDSNDAHVYPASLDKKMLPTEVYHHHRVWLTMMRPPAPVPATYQYAKMRNSILNHILAGTNSPPTHRCVCYLANNVS